MDGIRLYIKLKGEVPAQAASSGSLVGCWRPLAGHRHLLDPPAGPGRPTYGVVALTRHLAGERGVAHWDVSHTYSLTRGRPYAPALKCDKCAGCIFHLSAPPPSPPPPLVSVEHTRKWNAAGGSSGTHLLHWCSGSGQQVASLGTPDCHPVAVRVQTVQQFKAFEGRLHSSSAIFKSDPKRK